MKVVVLGFLAISIAAGIFYSAEAKTDQSTTGDSYEEQMNEGYKRLKNVPNEDDTISFLKQLHDLEKEKKDYFTPSPEQDSDVMKAMENYGKSQNDNIQPGDTIEEINRIHKVDAALFQGDMILTKNQADELMEDFKENEGIGKKTTSTS